MPKRYKNIKSYVEDTELRLKDNLNKAALFYSGVVINSFEGFENIDSQVNSSAPGEIPHIQTGTLKRSIKVGRPDLEGSVATIKVGSTLKPQNGQSYSYAYMLEFGSEGGQLAPRPYFRPAMALLKPVISKILMTGRV